VTALDLHHGLTSVLVGCCGVASSTTLSVVLRSEDCLPFFFPTTPTQYVFCDQIQFIIIFLEIIFLLFVLSSMLEYCILGFILFMFNLVRNLNLQLSIFPTQDTFVFNLSNNYSEDLL